MEMAASNTDRPSTATVAGRMFKLLSDGQPHTRKELKDCLWDELAQLSTIKNHIHYLRKVLRPDEDIVCEIRKNGICYRLVHFYRP